MSHTNFNETFGFVENFKILDHLFLATHMQFEGMKTTPKNIFSLISHLLFEIFE